MTDLPRILMVDDDPAIHAEFRKILAGDDAITAPAGRPPANPPIRFEIDSAESGADGLTRVTEARAVGRPYALVFTDVCAPHGWDRVENIERMWRGGSAL